MTRLSDRPRCRRWQCMRLAETCGYCAPHAEQVACIRADVERDEDR